MRFSGSNTYAPFPSMIVVFDRQTERFGEVLGYE